MAAVVASVGTVETKTGSTANFTVDFVKPTGLAVGDLMVAGFFHQGGSVGLTSVTKSGWTAESNAGTNEGVARLSVLYRIADAADVAASNFTFTTNYSGSGGGKVSGGILRITGHGAGVSPTSSCGRTDNANSTALSVTVNVTPAYDNSLILLLVSGDLSSLASTTVSGYAINGSSPTWTEHFDHYDTDGVNSVVALASATQTTAADITTASATFSVAPEDHRAFVVVITPQVDASADVGHLAVTPALFGIAGANTATASVGHLDASPTLRGLESVDSSDQTQWTNSDKPSTTWINVDK